ncbi:ATP-binding protein [uncultured Jannaschia sp.]|uniref:ATP-binding protein n=1 Tax=uncultured Jannaschia sp. TaxID=293347 RepID=UPI0026202929|nr:ATP-binding protein [uncultured Jannaschia sp.]
MFLVVALGALGVSLATASDASRDLLIAAAAALGAIFVTLHLISWGMARASHRRLDIVMEFLEHDAAPGFCTDEQGAIFAQNRAALDRFGGHDGSTMTRALEPLFANPDAVIHRLRLAAADTTSAREDVVTRRGQVRVAVHRIPGGYLWRLEDLVDRPVRAADGIGLPILTFGPSGTILYMNEILRSVVGRRAKRVRDLFDDVPLQNGGLNTLRTKDGPEQVRVVLSDPVNGRQEVFVLPGGEDADGRIPLDALPVALLKLDAGGSVTSANRAARDLLPPSGEGAERRLAAMVEGLGRSVREWVSEAAAGRGLNHAEIVRVTGASPERFLQITLGRPVGGGGEGLIAVLNDATALKTMEAQFVQSQKMQAIGQLAGGIAHDFNNLLTAISGHCDLLMLRHGEGDEDYADLAQITQNANRAAALVGQLLAFSRKQTLEMADIDLRDTLGDLTHLLNRLVGERVALTLSHDPALVPIRGDRRQLEQVLMNLVVNARDAMPDGGEIVLETQCRYLDRPMARDQVTVPAGQYVVITVSDQGSGIPPDAVGRIFEPFFTTKRPGEGTGLGLSMAYGIVKQCGGYIFVDSTPGVGTQFSLYFPGERARAEDAPAAISAPVFQPIEADQRPASDAPIAARQADEPGSIAVASEGDKADPAVSVSDGADDTQIADFEMSAGVAFEALASDIPPASDAVARVENETDVSASHADEEADDHSGATPHDDPSDDDVADAVVQAVEAASDDDEGAVKRAAVLEQSDGGPEIDPIDLDATSVEEADQPEVAVAQDIKAALGDMPRSAPEDRQPIVLLVEDEAPVRAFASRALRLRGYHVLEAACAEDALQTLEDRSIEVDLFVTDVMMPGLDGPTWVREALLRRPDVRTIFISGYTQDAMTETSAPVPNAVFLPKPFSLNDLTRTVERALV